MFGFRKRNEHTRALIVDIGSGNVSVGITDIYEDARPDIRAVVAQPMRLRQDINFDEFYLAMLEALTIGLTQLSSQKEVPIGSVDRVHITFASPWYMSEARTIQYDKGKESFTFNQRFLKKMLKDDLEQFKKEFDANKRVSGDDTLILLDRSVIDLRLNGYQTTMKEASSVHEVEATVFISLMSQKVRDAVVKRIRSVCGSLEYTVQSFPMVLYAVVRDLVVTGDDFVLVDVGGEVTDIAFVHDSVPERTYSIPLGHNTVIREVAKQLGTSLVHAQSALELYVTNKSDDEQAQHVGTAVQSVLDDFKKAFAEIVEEQAREFMLPKQVFYTADMNPVRWALRAIGKTSLENVTIGSYTTTPVMIGDTFLSHYTNYARGVARSPFIALESIFLNKIVYLDGSTDVA